MGPKGFRDSLSDTLARHGMSFGGECEFDHRDRLGSFGKDGVVLTDRKDPEKGERSSNTFGSREIETFRNVISTSSKESGQSKRKGCRVKMY